MKVLDPDGHPWTVRRQWAPRLAGRGPRARFQRMWERRKDGNSWAEVISLPFEVPDGMTVALFVVVALTAIITIVFVGLPLLLIVVDVVIVVALFVASVVARVVFRRPWTIVASAGDGRTSWSQAVGWSASRRLKEVLAGRITAGLGPPSRDPSP